MNPTIWLPLALLALFAGALVAFFTLRGGRRELPVDERAGEMLAAGLLPLADCPRNRDACLRCLLAVSYTHLTLPTSDLV